MVHGVFLDLDSVHPADLDLEPLRGALPNWVFHAHTRDHEVAERIRHAQVVVTNKVRIDAVHMRATPALRLICVAATGGDNIDLQAAAAGGIVVSNARDYATASVAEHVFALLLTLSRRLDSYRARVGAGDWTRSPTFCVFDDTIEELSHKHLGIIGYGTLGRAVSALAEAFSMQVHVAQRLYGEPLPGRLALDELLETCDVISLHCPLTEQTRGLIGAAQLRRMKPSALLINTARGGIVDEAALIEALQNGWIGGAGVDVSAEEPPAASSPLLRHLSPRLIVTPHVAWASRAARQRLLLEIRENIASFCRGTPRNRLA